MSVVIEENPGGDGNTPKVTPAGGGNPGGELAKTFTQAELDGIVNDRLTRERKKYDGFDDLKRKAGEFDKLADAQKSESERLTGQITDLTGQLTQAQQRERSYALRDAIEETINAADFVHAPRVSTGRLIRLLDLGDDDWDGEQPRNVKALLVKLQKAEPDLFVAKSRRTGSADAGEGGRETIAVSMNDRIRAAAGRGHS